MAGSEHAVKAVVCVSDAQRRATLADALRPAAALELLGVFGAGGDARPLLEQGLAELWLVDGDTLRGELGAALVAGERRDELRLVHVAAADGAAPPTTIPRRLDVTGLWSQSPGAAALVRARINSFVAETRQARRRAANGRGEPDEPARLDPPPRAARERAVLGPAAGPRVGDDPDAHALDGIAATPIDGVALIGSSGTPALLPHLLARVEVRAWPFVVAVHHNPAFADSFREWVGELLQAPARPLEALGSPRRAVGPWVVPAWASHGSDGPAVSPDLDRVLERLHASGGRWVIVIASGMGTLRAAALQPFAGAIVGLEPSCNPQPSMVLDAHRQGLIRAWVGVHSLARWLRTHGQHPPLAAAG